MIIFGMFINGLPINQRYQAKPSEFIFSPNRIPIIKSTTEKIMLYSINTILLRVSIIVALLMVSPASAAAGSCQTLAVDSGIANAGKSINGFLNDQYTWYDSNCMTRSVALARNDANKGGNAKQFTFVLPNGTTRTVNPSSDGASGFGYVVAHLSNPSFAWQDNGADDSPLGSGDSAAFNKLFAGSHHAIHEFTLNYVRYGLTQAALTNHSIDPWTWINTDPGIDPYPDPNRQYVTRYNMPVTIHWMFATGRNYPVWSVTFDLSQAPDHAVDSDFRAPYGDMNVEGGNGADLVGGIGWGDTYKFVSAGNPFTMNNDWDYSQPNLGAPYDYLWTSTVDAEMGLAGTQITAKQNAGGYNNYQATVWRGKTTANIGTLCVNDQGAGPGYDHKMPCTSDWAYQLMQYSVASAAETTNSKRLGWGADWGSLGNSGFNSSNGYAVSGWPKVSYSTFIVLDPHSSNPTQAVAKQAQTASLTTLTASVGSVRTQGPAGVRRNDNQTYSPAGYSPIFATWEVNAANNNVALRFVVGNSAPTTLDTPVIVVHNYTLATAPTHILLDGAELVAGSDYFASVRGAQSELWVTLNKKLAGTHSVQMNNAAAGNQTPIANAGADQTVNPGSLVTLHGNASTDPDNGPNALTYAWTQISGPAVVLSGPTTVSPTFTPNQLGDYVFGLVVNDGQANSPQSNVTIHVGKINQTINFGAAPMMLVGGNGLVSALGGASGNPVIFSSTTLGICTINGNTVTGIGVGDCTIAANQDGNTNYNPAPQVTKTFSIMNGYALTVSNSPSGGGSISSDVGGIDCGATCSSNFAGGLAVKLTAAAASGYQFNSWGGDCKVCGSGNACTLTVNAAKSCSANYAATGIENLVIYAEALGSGWQDWSWDTNADFGSTDYVHAGYYSAKVTMTAPWAAFRLEHAAFCASSYASLSFWVNGGAVDGRTITVSALLSDVPQTSVPLNNYVAGGGIAAGTWRLVTIPLADLGVGSNACDMNGFWLQDGSGSAQPAFYLDDIVLVAKAPANVNLNVNANQVVRAVDNRLFGVNTATWDGKLNTSATIALLQAADNKVMRFPGGSAADSYHWQTNISDGNNFQWASNFDSFANVVNSTGAQAYITVNYGSGTPQEAAGWVNYSNNTQHYDIKYWEIGNENYGAWENDTQARKNDPYTYAQRAKDYIAQMKAVDPSIKVGVVVIVGEDSAVNFTDHPATNPRTGLAHNGWTPVMLATLKSLNVTPDFVVYHRYEQEPGNESDATLLQAAQGWKNAAADLRQQLTDYLGDSGAAVELIATENNSVSNSPGKQSTSLVNGLYLADSLGNLMQTEFNGMLWWGLHNGQENGFNNSPSLYGWRQYGDYGIVSVADNPYPSYYAMQLMAGFARGGDQVVSASSDNNLLTAYAAKRANGTLSLLVINKSPTASQNASIQLTGFTPQANASVTSYGIPQDEAAHTGIGSPSPVSSALNNAAPTFSATFAPYSLTLISLGNNAILPAVATGAATAVTPASATLNGTVNPNGISATAQFEYGLTAAYGSTVSVTLSPNNGSSAQAVSASIGGLQAGATYHYRLTAANAQSTVGGSDVQFQTLALRLLTVIPSSGGTVGSDLGGINCGAVCGHSYANGMVIMLTATPKTGYSFAGWSGDCAGAALACALTMDAAKSVGASFKANQIITFGASPAVLVGGTGSVTATGGGSGNPVVFSSQTPAICTVSGTTVIGVAAGACTIAADQAGNASYNDAPQATQTFSIANNGLTALTINNANSTGGSVVSDTGGISCGSACSGSFASGATVRLTALSLDGYQFLGWSEDCAVCKYGNVCVVTMTVARSCAANFEPFVTHSPIWKKMLLSQ